MKTRRSFGQRIKDWWWSLPQEARDWLPVVGIWFLDGALIGTAVGVGFSNRNYKNDIKTAYAIGQIDGTLNAYKTIAQDATMNRIGR